MQPREADAEVFSKDRLAPMVRDCPALRGKVADARSRDSNNTILHKKFTDGSITMSASNSPAGLDSEDTELQALAVSGMSSYAANLPMVTPENYPSMAWLTPQGPERFPVEAMNDHLFQGTFENETDRAKYVTFWKNWWETFRPQILEASP